MTEPITYPQEFIDRLIEREYRPKLTREKERPSGKGDVPQDSPGEANSPRGRWETDKPFAARPVKG
jgi:hypothetical protein